MFFRSKDPDDRHANEVRVSDLAIIAIAAMLSAVGIYLMFSPTDYGAYFTKAGKALSNTSAPAQPQGRAGETQMLIFDTKKK